MYERYVAIGDSTTEGLEDPDGQGGYRGWANRLAEHLARAQGGQLHYANLAIRGREARQVRDEQLAAALAMRPDVVTLVAGVNDLLRPWFEVDQVAGDVAAMLEAFTRTGATVLTFTMPDMTRVMPLARLLRGRLFALNGRLRESCRRTGARLLDLAQHELGGDPRLWHEDRLHANARGHERIAMGLAHTLGLAGFEAWSSPLPPLPSADLRSQTRAEVRWAKRYLVPWVIRHTKGESSGSGRVPKRPELGPFIVSE
jgi:lysophospholipase L1-like esterase